jgi:hypothetical protein
MRGRAATDAEEADHTKRLIRCVNEKGLSAGLWPLYGRPNEAQSRLRFFHGFWSPQVVLVRPGDPDPTTERPGLHVSRGQEYLLRAMSSYSDEFSHLALLLMAACFREEEYNHRRKCIHDEVATVLVKQVGAPPWHHSCTGSMLPLVLEPHDRFGGSWGSPPVRDPVALLWAETLLSYERLAGYDIMVATYKDDLLPRRTQEKKP